MFNVKKAKRQKLIAAVGIIGASGSGKTLGALVTAYGMMKAKYPDLEDGALWEKIALIDTEHERSLVYEGMERAGVKIGQFLFISFEKPYTVDRYDAAQVAAKEAGAEIVIIDSASHAWESDGGLLDILEKFGGRIQDWKHVNPHYRKFINIITGEKNKVHTITTIRTKQKHEISATDTGKMEVKKLGHQPVMRDSLEYEFQVVFNVNMEHVASTSKDNSGLFEGKPEKLTAEHGKRLFQWLEEGLDVAAEEAKEKQAIIDIIRGLAAEHNGDVESIIQDLEGKANMPMEEMSLKLVNRMHLVILDRLEKMEIEKNIAATDKEVAK